MNIDVVDQPFLLEHGCCPLLERTKAALLWIVADDGLHHEFMLLHQAVRETPKIWHFEGVHGVALPVIYSHQQVAL